ncbi:hypothetical protein [Xanthomonas nasturtii]|uniref:hypothetical protein n=1 Tax=Xanthomonas nasturtii TaxID=1843581 RepID=UPI0020121540|nr:hypothetical protein [Xanthomonas nasturtii]
MDALSEQMRRQATQRCFDLWQLGHQCIQGTTGHAPASQQMEAETPKCNQRNAAAAQLLQRFCFPDMENALSM